MSIYDELKERVCESCNKNLLIENFGYDQEGKYFPVCWSCLEEKPEIITEKKCGKCRHVLDIDEFDIKPNSGEYYANCKSCTVYNQQKYHQNKQVKNGYCVRCYREKDGLLKQATFGFERDRQKIACSEHKDIGMVDLSSKNCTKCVEEGKRKRASFGFEHDKKRIACSEHKIEGMVDLTIKLCIKCAEEGKRKRASFGFQLDMKKLYCAKHKDDGMVNLVETRTCVKCAEEGKRKNASFGYETDGRRIACLDHRDDGMIDLVNRNSCCFKCSEEGIRKLAIFGFEKDNKKVACFDHKDPGMVDLAHKTSNCIECAKKGVKKRASFGFEEDGKKVACADHKDSGMVDLMSKICVKCVEEGKRKNASYGFESLGRRMVCAEHKEDGMIDLANKNQNCIVCIEEGISHRATYGPLFSKRIHCAVHKLPGEYTNNNPLCSDCPEKPIFGSVTDSIPQRCYDHKLETDVDLVRRECPLCGWPRFMADDAEMCPECLGFVPVGQKNNRGVKEGKIADLLKTMTSKIGEPIRDRRIVDGCSNKRPDFYYRNFNPYFDLIIEVDESQHSRYTCGVHGEFLRLINIHENDLGGTPVVVVRFNPDDYYFGEKIVKAYRGREKLLKSVLLNLKNRKEPLDTEIGVIYLFYDQFEEGSECIVPFEYTVNEGMVCIKHKHPRCRDREYKISLE